MSEQISYRDYLILTAAHAASALTDGIRKAINLHDDYAIEHLEHTLEVAGKLVQIGETTDRVAPRPERTT